MKKQDFETLVTSIKEAGEIKAGKIKICVKGIPDINYSCRCSGIFLVPVINPVFKEIQGINIVIGYGIV